MRKFVNIVLIICTVALAIVIGAVIFFAWQNKTSDADQNIFTTKAPVQSDIINNSSDLVETFSDQTADELNYFQALGDESSLVVGDTTELSNVSEAYNESDF